MSKPSFREGWLSKPDFAEKLRFLRARHGLTQIGLCDKIGCTRAAVVYWTNGLHYPDPYAREKMAEIFGMTVDELMTEPLSESQKKYVRTRKHVMGIRLANPVRVAQAILQKMNEKGITMDQLSETAKVSKRTVYGWLSGKHAPGFLAAEKLMNLLDLPESIFYGADPATGEGDPR